MQEAIKRRAKQYSIGEKAKRFVRFIYYKILRIQASPEMIARGCAIGIFFGCMPIIPMQTTLSLFFAMISSSSKTGAALGTLITNPVTIFPFYYSYYKIGGYLLGTDVRFSISNFNIIDLIESSPDLCKAMLLGGFLVAVPFAIVTYFLVLRLIHTYQLRKQAYITKRELKKMEELRQSLEQDKENNL